MYKIIGASLLLISALFGALTLIYKEKRRIIQLEAFTVLIRFIYKQIEVFNLPLPEILEKADKNILKLCGWEGEEQIDFEGLLCREGLFIDSIERNMLLSFSAGLGRCYRDEQLRHCNYYLSELEKCLTGRKNDYPKKKKLIITLSICAALGLIIIMI